MALIKNIHGTTNLKKVLPNKIPIREKWEQYKKQTAQKLNNQTKHWERKQKRQFLLLFCFCFTGLMILSFCFLTKQHYEGKSVPVPVIPQKLLLPEQQVLKTLPPPEPEKIPPPLVDSGKYQQQ